ncbi:uncharacterized protein Z519_09558 [Cladophialophora bantiana CBS 173.52]|uniref:Uncharacterized protein n=1 Tax=Cladophialophora bantiana (strain ATCC 10958 / CBS 173.52 / CDC B-1940 / NIH 8579) TaxID=1442370 RepID=A0A0D2FUA8_CLAB1|nr:uncharacterized protein Z519_09558 [Cladophialophora bantiana CBS 173.52]KIW90127.1 hypothetical protein Z519_09558 [Cladophialophora bantiana CBS 173.52]
MSGETKDMNDSFDSAPGGRNSGEVAKPGEGNVVDNTPDYIPKGFSKKDIENMGGSLKVHVRLALEVDIRVIAKVKGDICIGIL